MNMGNYMHDVFCVNGLSCARDDLKIEYFSEKSTDFARASLGKKLPNI